jgi:hypothetical protein
MSLKFVLTKIQNMFIFHDKKVIMLVRAMTKQNNLFNANNMHILVEIRFMASGIFNNKISRSEVEIGCDQNPKYAYFSNLTD